MCDPGMRDECGICGGPGVVEPWCNCYGDRLDCEGTCGGFT